MTNSLAMYVYAEKMQHVYIYAALLKSGAVLNLPTPHCITKACYIYVYCLFNARAFPPSPSLGLLSLRRRG